MSLAEAIANVAIGYGIAVLTQMIVFPLFGLRLSISDNLVIGAVFTLVSIVRSYAVRRMFEALAVRRRQGATAARLRGGGQR
jgi:hypothetical protein